VFKNDAKCSQRATERSVDFVSVFYTLARYLLIDIDYSMGAVIYDPLLLIDGDDHG